MEASMTTYAYILKLVPRLYDAKAWTKAENETIDAHFMRLKEDYGLGVVLHVGRTSDPAFDGFGFVVFQAGNEEEAHAYANKDPAVIAGIMTVSVKEYKLIFR